MFKSNENISYDTIIKLSYQMLTLAKEGQWNDLISLNSHYQSELNHALTAMKKEIIQAEAINKDISQVAAKKIADRLFTDNSQLTALIKEEMLILEKRILAFNDNRKASSLYQQQQCHSVYK